MNYNEYIVTQGTIDRERGGKVTASIILPCFSGDETDFQAAARLNGFYTYAAGVLYSYAASVTDPDARQIGYSCRSEVEIDGSVVSVTLHILERRVYRGRKSEIRRKTLSHVFRDGYAVRRRTQVE
ncbi:MAG: hypothetical protein ACI4V1_06770 [Eubacteriales bacterium]